MCGAGVKAHLPHAAGSQGALEATHEVGVVEHGPTLGMAEHKIVVSLVRRGLVVAIQFARESIRHWDRAGRPPGSVGPSVYGHTTVAHGALGAITVFSPGLITGIPHLGTA